MLVGPGEKVEKGQVVYSLIKDQQSKWTTWPTTQFTNIMVKGVGTCAPQPTNSRSQQNRRASFHQRSTIQLNNTIYQHIDYQSLPLRYGHGCTTADQSQTTFSKRRSSLLMWLQTKLNLLPGFRMFLWRREERTIKQSELEMRNIVQQDWGLITYVVE